MIQRYSKQQETLFKTVEQQRDGLFKDVELAAQVQRLFLPTGKATIPGLEIAGLMHPAQGVGGDYFDYFPIDAHTTQIVIADVSGKGVPAALLMSATAAALRLEANRDRNMLAQLKTLNTELSSLSDPERYVTLLAAKIDTRKRIVQYVNCGHNPALLFRASTGTLTHLTRLAHPSECRQMRSVNWPPKSFCLAVTSWFSIPMASRKQKTRLARNSAWSDFPRQCSAVLTVLLAEGLTNNIYNSAADFCGDAFGDDVTILVVKCQFDRSSTPTS